MVVVETLAVTLGAAAFSLAAFTYHGRRTRLERALGQLADERGWDYRRAGEADPVPDAPAEIGARGAANRCFRGPSAHGAFRLVEYRSSQKGNTAAGVLLALPMSRPSPGLAVLPQRRFRLRGPRSSAWQEDAAFMARFRVAGEDPAFTDRALGPAVRGLLLKPSEGVRLVWSGHTVWVWFPVSLDNARAVTTLIRYGETLAGLLAKGGDSPRARRIAMPDPHPDPNAVASL